MLRLPFTHFAQRRILNTKLLPERALIILAASIVPIASIIGFSSIASAASNCNTPSTARPNLFMFEGGGSQLASVQPQKVTTQIGLISDECASGMDVPAAFTGGNKTVPYPDWHWNYQQTSASLAYANVNTTPKATTGCTYGDSDCEVYGAVIAVGFGKLASPTGTNEGFYVKCLSYLTNPLGGSPQMLRWDVQSRDWVPDDTATDPSACVNTTQPSDPPLVVTSTDLEG